jgi:hypothetical protein
MRPKSMYDPIQEESEPISMPDQWLFFMPGSGWTLLSIL